METATPHRPTPVSTAPLADERLDSVVARFLEEQRATTAVDRFARAHDAGELPARTSIYRHLIPLELPREGEQYAFEVDLDSCSGCKSCVAACHALNGLEEDELWRSVGLLHGGSTLQPVVQHVTAACHHCIEPACLEGCPVNAYEKDPLTGVVVHLDDQCIGCQYCMLKCPYDVPKYSHSKGIVRKCDMCRNRLAVGEAPACVQACPNEAIRIRTVDKQSVVEECEGGQFLPGAHEPGYTVPTTVYHSRRPFPRNLLPADYYRVLPGHGHLPLVFMLVLTQMSVGAFVVDQVLFSDVFAVRRDITGPLRSMHLIAALLLGLLGLGAAVLHLGRPLYAFRALLGLRTSWLSREILAFNVFAAMAACYVAAAGGSALGRFVPPRVESTLGLAAAATGLVGVLCSVMIYVDTRRRFWSAGATTTKFLLTTAVLGLPTAALISLLAASASTALTVRDVMDAYGWTCCRLLATAAAAKLSAELLLFASLRHRQQTPLRRTALVMTGPLGMTTLKRFFFGIVGGLLLPLVLLSEDALAPGTGFHPLFIVLAVGTTLLLLTVGELLERYLFFAASVAPKMPGIPAS